MIAQALKERKILNVSHQTIINFLEEYGLNRNWFETVLDGKLRLQILIGKKLEGMKKTPVFVLDVNDDLLDLHLVDIGKISVLRSMLNERWHLPVLQSLDLALYSLISPYDIEVTRGPVSLASDLSYKLRDFLKGRKRKVPLKSVLQEFLTRRENG